jgi:hypothetical protein
MNKSWEVILEEDENGEVILPFPPELIKRYGWLEGDEIEFEIGDGCATITNTTAKIRGQENSI